MAEGGGQNMGNFGGVESSENFKGGGEGGVKNHEKIVGGGGQKIAEKIDQKH